MRSRLTRTFRGGRTKQVHIHTQRDSERRKGESGSLRGEWIVMQARGTCLKPYARTKTRNFRTAGRILDVMEGD